MISNLTSSHAVTVPAPYFLGLWMYASNEPYKTIWPQRAHTIIFLHFLQVHETHKYKHQCTCEVSFYNL